MAKVKKKAKAKKKSSKNILLKGNFYKKAELGVKGPDFRKTEVIIKGKRFLFFSIKNGRYLNELHSDGIVFEPRSKNELISDKVRILDKYKGRHIMVRYLPISGSAFEYIGDELYIARHDLKRNKIFVE